MQSYQATLHLQSAFATPLKGDTLFGQLCWALRNRFGEDRLTELLAGYTQGQPFAVVADALPQGWLPLPKLPGSHYDPIEGADRKALKKRAWLAEDDVTQPLRRWLSHAKSAADIAGKSDSLGHTRSQPHNTINRQTNTTGENGFAPFSIEQQWFVPGLAWTLYLLLDENRLSADDCRLCLTDIGQIGFGRDASIGLGKFALSDFAQTTLPGQTGANACLTLAPCAPQGLGFDGNNSFYQLFTRFGRHGDIAVHSQGKPFKNPVLLAQTAALFATPPPASGFIGQGLGGVGQLSKTLAATVHQGYAPVIATKLDTQD
ncbi:MAG: CRISPR-associated protein Csm7 [Methylomonas sp.]|nr:CRISPR-associated protein Csm7 [Methylomonas sp.]PPD21140.1 MAG: CRISPR-associated protein Csm7 [Methylomonas sp.]PPD27574.1 MAG: CRISPR-associated protein Csm7 [Methylomonas sp.]PPD39570.1 MAG: CRISPR-associated protein Csm7 [Methylomonas sp.]PPD55821.1 MAG: CRISPR-associated protein Csm7 [Methylomonas sp.]